MCLPQRSHRLRSLRPPARDASRPWKRSLSRGSPRLQRLCHPLLVALMLVSLGDRAGRIPASLDALDLLADVPRGRAERVSADLGVRQAGAQRANLGYGIILRHAELERL